MPKSHNLNKPVFDTLGKTASYILGTSKKKHGNVLLVEGPNDKILYEKIALSLNQTIIVQNLSQISHFFLDNSDQTILKGTKIKKGISPKQAIILIIKRYGARIKLKKKLPYNLYGIIDKDYFLKSDILNVEEKMEKAVGTYEELIADYYDVLKEKRIIQTDTNDVETLIFKFDLNAVVQSKPMSISQGSWNSYIDTAEEKACRLGFIRRQSELNEKAWNDSGKKIKINFFKMRKFLDNKLEINNKLISITPPPYKQYALTSLVNMQDIKKLIALYPFSMDQNYWCACIPSSYTNDWSKPKGHDLVNILLELANQSNTCFANEVAFINAILNNVTVSNFQKTRVYKFIEKI